MNIFFKLQLFIYQCISRPCNFWFFLELNQITWILLRATVIPMIFKLRFHQHQFWTQLVQISFAFLWLISFNMLDHRHIHEFTEALIERKVKWISFLFEVSILNLSFALIECLLEQNICIIQYITSGKYLSEGLLEFSDTVAAFYYIFFDLLTQLSWYFDKLRAEFSVLIVL